MNKKRTLIISSILFVIVIATLFVSYGYITAEISGNETSKNTVFNGQILKVEYSGGTNELTSSQDAFIPGSTLTKTFTIKNTGNVSVKYSIVLDNVKNSFERKNDITYELSSNDVVLKNGMYDATGIFPDNKSTILNIDTLTTGQSKTYTLKINYLTSEENQIVDSGKSLSAEILIEESKPIINNLIVYGNSIQDGTPSPENPIEIESVGDKTDNLFDGEFEYGIILGPTGEVGGYNEKYIRSKNFIEVKPNTEYKFSVDSDSFTHMYVYEYNENKEYVLTNNKNIALTKTLTTDANTKYIKFRPAASAGVLTLTSINVQFQEGNVATKYEPYGYKIPLTIRGNNLISEEKIIEHGFVKQSDGSYYVKKSSTPYKQVLYENKNKKEGSITISYYTKFVLYNNYVGCYPMVYYTDGTYTSLGGLDIISKKPTEYVHVVYTTPKSKIVDRIQWGYYTGGAQTYIKDLQVEWNDNYTQFNPYAINTNIYLKEPLRKVAEYADYIDFKNNIVIRNVNKIDLQEYEFRLQNDTNPFFYIFNVLPKPLTSSRLNVYSNILPNGEIGANTSYIGVHSYTSGIVRFRPDMTVYDTLDKWKEYINNDVEKYIVYVTEEQTEDIELPNIPTYKDKNIIEICSNNGVCASNIEVEYDE